MNDRRSFVIDEPARKNNNSSVVFLWDKENSWETVLEGFHQDFSFLLLSCVRPYFFLTGDWTNFSSEAHRLPTIDMLAGTQENPLHCFHVSLTSARAKSIVSPTHETYLEPER